MKNNWVLQEDPRNDELLDAFYDQCSDFVKHYPSIGDEIETYGRDEEQGGVIVGTIYNRFGEPVCYKVLSRIYENETDYTDEYDYVAAKDVAICEECFDPEWSLGRFGYRLVETCDGSCFVHEGYGDVVSW